MNSAHASSPNALRLFASIVVAALAVAAASPHAVAQSKSGFQYNGMDYTDYSATGYLTSTPAAQAIRATSANYTAVMATWYVQTPDATTIAAETASSPGYDSSKDPLSPTDAAVVAAIQALQAQGITVTLKPHVDSIDGTWRGEFTWPSTDTTTDQQQAWLTAWFTSYQSFILHFAKIASDNGVGTLVIGTEFAKLTGNTCAGSSCEPYWQQYVITPLRQQYPNLTLVYGANATSAGDEFTTVTFWNDIDIIGVDGYFPIDNSADCNTSTPPDPTLAELEAGWTDNPCSGDFNAVQALKNLSSSYPGKPLIFTEIGYPSATGSNAAPYNFTPAGAFDDAEQNNLYEAFFTVFSPQTSWMKGVFWWAWSVAAPGANDTGYSPQNKTAGDTTLPLWYGAQAQGFTLAPANAALTIGQDSSGSTVIAVTPLDGFNGNVILSASGLPAGVSASFGAGTGLGTQSVIFTANATAPASGPTTVTIAGTSGSLTATTTIALTVTAPESFALSASPSSMTLHQSSSATSTITVSNSGGFSGAVTIVATGLPNGVTAAFTAGSKANTQVLTLTAISTAALGQATVTLTGTGASGSQTLTATATIQLTVAPPAAFEVVPGLSTLSVVQGSTNTDTFTITDNTGFSGNVTLAASGLPQGVTAAFSPNPASSSSVLTLTASSSAELGGPVTITITGTSGANTASTTIDLTVQIPASFTVSSANPTATVALGGTATDGIQITKLGGFNGSVAFTVTGLPTGVTAALSPNPATGTSSTVTFTASSTATIGGPVDVTITGTAGTVVEEATVSLTVTGAPAFGPTGTEDSTITIKAGATSGNTATIAVIGVNGFTGTVNLTCAITPVAKDGPACVLAPTSVALSGNVASASLLTINSAAPGSAMNQPDSRPRNLIWPSAGGTALAFVLFAFVPLRRRNWLALGILLALSLSMGVAGCTGGNGKGGGPGTTTGSYTVTVTGASGSTNVTLSTIKLTIQ